MVDGMERQCLYIGTWTEAYDTNGNAAIEVFRQEKDRWNRIQTIVTGYSVSKIQADIEKMLLYVCLETRNYTVEEAGGQILWYKIDKATGALSFGGTANSCGAYPIDLILEKDYALVLNHGSTTGRICVTGRSADGAVRACYRYDAASLVLFERCADGSLGKAKDFYLFSGNGPVPFFQNSPSPHSLYRLPEENHYLVPERGTDQISFFDVDRAELKIQPGKAVRAPASVGPRNAVAFDEGNTLFVIGEIEPELLYYEKKEECWQLAGELFTVPQEELKGSRETRESFEYPHPVDLQISRDGRFLYTLTRYSNILGVFQSGDGEMTDAPQACKLCGDQYSPRYYRLSGSNPRQMILQNHTMLILFHDTGNIITLQLDPVTGYPEKEKMMISGIKNIAVMELIDLG